MSKIKNLIYFLKKIFKILGNTINKVFWIVYIHYTSSNKKYVYTMYSKCRTILYYALLHVNKQNGSFISSRIIWKPLSNNNVRKFWPAFSVVKTSGDHIFVLTNIAINLHLLIFKTPICMFYALKLINIYIYIYNIIIWLL